MVILYLGPNTLMPLASILAAIAGVILIFWQYIRRAVVGILRFVFRRKPRAATSEEKADGQASN